MTVKTIDKRLEEKKAELAAIGQRLDILTALNEATGLDSWGAVDTWLGKELNAAYLSLAVTGTSVERTNELRGEIAAMIRLRGLPKMVLAGISDLGPKAEVLRKEFAEWHNRGRAELRSTVEAATQLSERTSR